MRPEHAELCPAGGSCAPRRHGQPHRHLTAIISAQREQRVLSSHPALSVRRSFTHFSRNCCSPCLRFSTNSSVLPTKKVDFPGSSGTGLQAQGRGGGSGAAPELGDTAVAATGTPLCETWVPGAQRPRIGVWGFCPRLFPVRVGLTGNGKQRVAGSMGHTYTKPAFFWSCRLSHTNSRYRRRTHEVLAVKALLLVCKITQHGNHPGD